jgi:hypothetical protein
MAGILSVVGSHRRMLATDKKYKDRNTGAEDGVRSRTDWAMDVQQDGR